MTDNIESAARAEAADRAFPESEWTQRATVLWARGAFQEGWDAHAAWQAAQQSETRARCNCGFGGQHDDGNEKCDLTQWENDRYEAERALIYDRSLGMKGSPLSSALTQAREAIADRKSGTWYGQNRMLTKAIKTLVAAIEGNTP
jgi:hypothetical protein